MTSILEKNPPPEQVTVIDKTVMDLPSIYVDAQQISQVLINLINNAYQAMPDGGELLLQAKVEGEYIGLSLSDTGCGMSAETLEKIFEPLFTTKARGIGLGLAVSRNLIEVNGGQIEVKSTEGQGSIFTLILPT